MVVNHDIQGVPFNSNWGIISLWGFLPKIVESKEGIEMKAVTASEVIQKRSEQLFQESLDLASELQAIERRREEILIRQAEIAIEQEILSAHNDIRSYKVVHTEVTVVEKSGRKKITDKMDFETSLHAIFARVNYRAMRMAEIIDQLEQLGFKWSSYGSAYNYISSCDCLENQSRGYYSLRR